MKTVNEVVRDTRKEKRMTQEQLAKAIDVTPGFITKIETGKSYPGYERCMTLCEVLGLPFDKIWAQIKEEKQPPVFIPRARVSLATTGEGAGRTGTVLPVEVSADDIAQELEADLVLKEAYINLKTALADPEAHQIVVYLLRAIANQVRDSR
jgi:transcriptional regulator with XRE-family HTH domain